jgi:hypothetical protein
LKKHSTLIDLFFNAETIETVPDAWYSDNVTHMNANERKDILAGVQPFLATIT